MYYYEFSGTHQHTLTHFSKIFQGLVNPIQVIPIDGVQEITLPSTVKATADNGIVKILLQHK
ncbi:hypothetical protein [Fredinandcohnia sp. 179-A 10B2 NHS]|uniref:hypothetical protein n=1 Tax=Fredinandcohnia sp. 179-A 10B2 NHS TaxID=3235176 RepID=UPI0039A31307